MGWGSSSKFKPDQKTSKTIIIVTNSTVNSVSVNSLNGSNDATSCSNADSDMEDPYADDNWDDDLDTTEVY